MKNNFAGCIVVLILILVFVFIMGLFYDGINNILIFLSHIPWYVEVLFTIVIIGIYIKISNE